MKNTLGLGLGALITFVLIVLLMSYVVGVAVLFLGNVIFGTPYYSDILRATVVGFVIIIISGGFRVTFKE